MTPVSAFTELDAPSGLQRGRGGFWRGKNDAPWVSDPDGALVKGGERKGELKRVPYGSPSNAGKPIEDTMALAKWGERMVVTGIGLMLNIDDILGVNDLERDTDEWRQACDKVIVAAKDAAKAALAADRGTHTHLTTEDDDSDRDWIARAEAGEELGIPADAQAALVAAWRHMLARDGIEILATEAACVDDRWRLAGTLDRIARCTRDLRFARPDGEIVTVPAGTVFVLDIKTGKRIA